MRDHVLTIGSKGPASAEYDCIRENTVFVTQKYNSPGEIDESEEQSVGASAFELGWFTFLANFWTFLDLPILFDKFKLEYFFISPNLGVSESRLLPEQTCPKAQNLETKKEEKKRKGI